ncbi:homeobox protein NANOG [Electrophorus electricus]|uniref:Homeobox domain-containing protein n=1 Tax=Electrophorus electricus TaxID=8005 RepID=A0A4W4G5W8_ELEEL|nr:homeobox protein NANOG [Electrophorus electricus]
MADWKVPLTYNYNPSYHAYAYGLVYPQGTEQSHPNVGWAEAAYGPPAGLNGGYYSSPATSTSPPEITELASTNINGQYPNPAAYYRDPQTHTQNGRLFLSHNGVHYGQQMKARDRAGSDAPSDSEAHTPDSWSSGSSRGGGNPQGDLDVPPWIKKERAYETDSGSSDGSEVVSSSRSVATEASTSLNLGGDGLLPAPTVVPSPPEQPPAQPRKAKARTAFSEGQMNALTDRFNVQRYLTPAEMKTLAGLTGLTYKQVKTWFQNRRMKLKRHQKDNSWVSERYISTGITNASTPHSQFHVDAPVPSQDLYMNTQFRDAVFSQSSPQVSSFYPGYNLPLSPSQVSTRPQGNWPLPPAVMHYEFPNPSSYVPANGSTGFNSDGAVDPGTNATQMTTTHTVTQWSS